MSVLLSLVLLLCDVCIRCVPLAFFLLCFVWAFIHVLDCVCLVFLLCCLCAVCYDLSCVCCVSRLDSYCIVSSVWLVLGLCFVVLFLRFLFHFVFVLCSS